MTISPRDSRGATTRTIGWSVGRWLGASLVAAVLLVSGQTSHAMGEEEFFAEEAAQGHLDLELLTSSGELDTCFLYDERRKTVFCVATEQVGEETVWQAVFYDGKRHKRTLISLATRPKSSTDDEDWVARARGFKKANARLRRGRWSARTYRLDFDEGKRTPVADGFSVEVRGGETELALYAGDEQEPRATYPLQGLSDLYSAEGELPVIVVDTPAAEGGAPGHVRVRLVFPPAKGRRAAPKRPRPKGQRKAPKGAGR